MSKVFLTSDLHFGHQNIIEYSERPFASIEEMDEALIDNWNSVVNTEDTVFVLGDFAMGDRANGLQHLRRMHGTKILVNGNHDRCSPVNNNAWKYQQSYLRDDEGNTLFSAVMDHTVISLPGLGKNQRNRRVMASHYPYTGDHTERPELDRFRLRDEGQWLVHGHIHNEAWLQRSEQTGTVMFNVGVDVNNFTPIEARVVHQLMHDFRESGDPFWDSPGVRRGTMMNEA